MSFSKEWKSWIAENLILCIDEETLLGVLASEGFSISESKAELRKIRLEHALAPAIQVANRYKKLERQLQIKRELQQLSGPIEITRVPSIDCINFLEKFYSANKPLIVESVVSKWPAYQKWSPQFFADNYGDVRVSVNVKSANDSGFPFEIKPKSVGMTMSEFCTSVLEKDNSAKAYLVANNRALENTRLSALYEDVRCSEPYLANESMDGRTFLWFGPCGTITPLHYDTSNLILAQVYGAKVVTLIPPEDSPLLYNDIGVFSSVDLEFPNGELYPLFKNARQARILLRAGEMLFIPVGWWHHVRAVSVSINVSFTNFIFPNDYSSALFDAV